VAGESPPQQKTLALVERCLVEYWVRFWLSGVRSDKRRRKEGAYSRRNRMDRPARIVAGKE
jgi:hypothetical protein